MLICQQLFSRFKYSNKVMCQKLVIMYFVRSVGLITLWLWGIRPGDIDNHYTENMQVLYSAY